MRQPLSDIFIVDDDIMFREELIHLLEAEGHSVRAFADIASCRGPLKDRPPLLILLDIQLPDGNGVEFLKEIASCQSHPEVVMVSGAASLQEAADSMKTGAADFIEKPFEPQRLISIVNNCIRIAKLKQENQGLVESRLAEYDIVGHSSAMHMLRDRIRQIAGTDARVIITGESGTGKELAAGQIHYLSGRASAPFVKVNCSALPSELVESELFGHERGSFTGAVRSHKGRFVQADGGTLLLDEIGDMPLDIQPKLLRVIENGDVEPVGSTNPVAVDVRLISSTNRDLEELAKNGRFRYDLLYRIDAVRLHLPPLREHREDIPQLADRFLHELSSGEPSTERILEANAIDILVSHDWPGNVRQLRNVIERLYYTTTAENITADMVKMSIDDRGDAAGEGLPDDAAAGRNRLAAAVAHFEHGFLKSELKKAGGNVTRLAGRLGMDRGNLYRKLKKAGLL